MKKPRPRGYYGPDKGKYQKIQKLWARAGLGKNNGENKGISMVKIREYQCWKKGTNSQKGGPSVRPLGLPSMASFLP